MSDFSNTLVLLVLTFYSYYMIVITKIRDIN